MNMIELYNYREIATCAILKKRRNTDILDLCSILCWNEKGR